MSTWLDGKVEIRTGDITKLEVDVVVNAANAALSGGGGVDGAIHRAAGPELLAACRKLGGARPGEVRVTRGYRLPASYIVHAVGPVWQGGERGEPELLASCYREALARVSELGLATVAFPSISTGAYRFPVKLAARIALTTVQDEFATRTEISRVVFCCFVEKDARVYEAVAAEVLAGEGG